MELLNDLTIGAVILLISSGTGLFFAFCMIQVANRLQPSKKAIRLKDIINDL